MQEFTPSRFLNDPRGFVGLSLSDFIAAVVLFGFISRLFEDTTIEYLALPISLMCLAGIAPIRLKTRRKIIRDSISFFITKRRVYDPRSSIF